LERLYQRSFDENGFGLWLGIYETRFYCGDKPYKFGNQNAGCFAQNHPSHQDREESFFVNYEAVWNLFDELHKAKPDLFIDCTF
jgi:hypothetical protein